MFDFEENSLVRKGSARKMVDAAPRVYEVLGTRFIFMLGVDGGFKVYRENGDHYRSGEVRCERVVWFKPGEKSAFAWRQGEQEIMEDLLWSFAQEAGMVSGTRKSCVVLGAQVVFVVGKDGIFDLLVRDNGQSHGGRVGQDGGITWFKGVKGKDRRFKEGVREKLEELLRSTGLEMGIWVQEEIPTNSPNYFGECCTIREWDYDPDTQILHIKGKGYEFKLTRTVVQRMVEVMGFKEREAGVPECSETPPKPTPPRDRFVVDHELPR